MTHLWEPKHPYYCAESSYGLDDDIVDEHSSWASFMAENGDADPDYNLVFRWDWKWDGGDETEDEPNGPAPDDEYLMYGTLRVFWMVQRKGYHRVSRVRVCKANEGEVLAWPPDGAGALAGPDDRGPVDALGVVLLDARQVLLAVLVGREAVQVLGLVLEVELDALLVSQVDELRAHLLVDAAAALGAKLGAVGGVLGANGREAVVDLPQGASDGAVGAWHSVAAADTREGAETAIARDVARRARHTGIPVTDWSAIDAQHAERSTT